MINEHEHFEENNGMQQAYTIQMLGSPLSSIFYIRKLRKVLLRK